MVRIASILALVCAVAPLAAAQTPQSSAPCAASEYRALDFWVGEWDAFRGDTNALSGHSSVTAIEGGCAIHERWTNVGQPYAGQSINIYVSATGHWEQFWVDTTGRRTHFVGEPIENGVRFRAENPSGAPARFTRMSLTEQPDGTVHQRGETSADGATWALSFLLIYRRRGE